MMNLEVSHKPLKIEDAANQIVTLQPSSTREPYKTLHVGEELKPYFQLRRYFQSHPYAALNNYELKDVIFDAASTLLFREDSVVEDSRYLVPFPLFSDRRIDAELINLPKDETYAVGFNSGSANYYHWMTECLPAIFSSSLAQPKAIIIPRYASFQKRSLDLLGLNDCLFHPDRTRQYKIANLVVSNFLYGNFTYVRPPFAQQLYDKLSSSIPDDNSNDPLELIYISRADSNSRVMLNESELIQGLEKQGFKSISLSSLSLDDQIRVFRNAKIIVAPHGAGMANIAFCNKDCKVYELTPIHYINPCFVSLAQLAGLEYWIDAFQSLDGGDRHQRQWIANVDFVLRRVDTILAQSLL